MPYVRLGWFVILAACTGSVPIKGDEQMGHYEFTADFAGRMDCDMFPEIPDAGFTFDAYFSRNRDGTGTWVTIGGVAHDADWDGQKIHAEYSARRNFTNCSCGMDAGQGAVTTMTETITATLVSKSQSDALGGCDPVPPVDEDAGVTKPGETDGGFDAVRACGTLEEHITTDPFTETSTCLAACNGCRLSYVITGDRK